MHTESIDSVRRGEPERPKVLSSGVPPKMTLELLAPWLVLTALCILLLPSIIDAVGRFLDRKQRKENQSRRAETGAVVEPERFKTIDGVMRDYERVFRYHFDEE